MNTKKILGVVAVLALVAVAMVGAGAAASDNKETSVNYDLSSGIVYEFNIPETLAIDSTSKTGSGDYTIQVTTAGSSSDTRYAYIWLKSATNYNSGFYLADNYGSSPAIAYDLKAGSSSSNLVPAETVSSANKIVGAPVNAIGAAATEVKVNAKITGTPVSGVSYSDKLTFATGINANVDVFTLTLGTGEGWYNSATEQTTMLTSLVVETGSKIIYEATGSEGSIPVTINQPNLGNIIIYTNKDKTLETVMQGGSTITTGSTLATTGTLEYTAGN